MKSIFTIAIAAIIFASGLTAEASTAFCFPGWFGGWGAGYAPGPYYASRPYFGGVSAGYYGSNYGGGYGGACGCSPCNSCSPCGTSCGASNCATGNCGTGCGVISSDSYSPQRDPNFREGTEDRRRDDVEPDEDDNEWQNRRRNRNSLDDDLNSDRRFEDDESGLGRPDAEKPSFLQDRKGLDSGSSLDSDRGINGDSNRPGAGLNEDSDAGWMDDPLEAGDGFGVDDGGFGGSRENQKPALTEEPAAESDEVLSPPDDETSLLLRGRLSQRDARLSHTADSSRVRLTGFSTRSQRQSQTRWSGRTHKRNNNTKRWIGIPAVDGRTRL